MYIKIGPYINWVGPYQIAEKILFWKDKYSDQVVSLGNFLAYGSFQDYDAFHDKWLYKLCNWVHSKRKRTFKVRIDEWDSWNLDSTLGPIVLPLLKQLKATQHGSGQVDLEDVPEHMRTTTHNDYDEQHCFDFYFNEELKPCHDIHTRWEWVLDEMIWAFEQTTTDWEEQYQSGERDIKWEKSGEFYKMIRGPNDTYTIDLENYEKHRARIANGLRLFGKYFQSLWD